MKRAINFRLSSQATNILAILEKKMHTSKTEVVEKALQYYAKKKLPHQKNLILEYAGILSEKEADSMLALIESSKHNKDVDVEL